MNAAPIHSLQLYSGRKFPPLASQLDIVARHGYAAVETFGPLHDDPAGTRALLDARGLRALSGHLPMELLEADPARAVAIARTLGLEYVVAPYLQDSDRPSDIDGWRALGARLGRINACLAADGLKFAWHNHDFEFQPLPEGVLPIELLLGEGLLWEADLAWVTRAGADPVPWIERYKGRIPLVHVKDIARAGDNADEDGWADVGMGIVPWDKLWPRCVAAGAKIMIAEHDNPSDFDRFARVSLDAMRRFAKG